MNESAPQRDPACVFCKIVAGDILCHKLHEDEQVLAFLDVGPLAIGHALIVPKAHHVTLDTMPGDLAAACMRIAPSLAKAILNVTGATAYNVLQNNGELANQAVPHVHFHIIPKTDDTGLGIDWRPGELPTETARDLRTKIVAAMERRR